MGHRQGEPDRFLGSILADNLRQGLKLPGGFKRQIFEYAGFIQLMQWQ
jgi:hypothetical protein